MGVLVIWERVLLGRAINSGAGRLWSQPALDEEVQRQVH